MASKAAKVAGAKKRKTASRMPHLEQAVQNHIGSFNNLLDNGLQAIVEALALHPAVVPLGGEDPNTGTPCGLYVTNLEVARPKKRDVGGLEEGNTLLPSECRLANCTYAGQVTATLSFRVGESTPTEFTAELGAVPIMVRSSACHLGALQPKELARAGEDEAETGGYFVLNGLERVVRILLMPRSNFPMAVNRQSYKKRGKLYTEHGCVMRCMRKDGSTMTNTLHYCVDGSVFLRFSYAKEEWLIPFVLAAKAVFDVSDGLLLTLLSGSDTNGSIYYEERAMMLIQQQNSKMPIAGMLHARKQLGKTFRIVLGHMLPPNALDEEVGQFIAQRFFLCHVDSGWHKLQCMVVMYQKLIGLARGDIDVDNQDAFSNHELLLPGHLYGMVLKESLESITKRALGYMRKAMMKKSGAHQTTLDDYRTQPALLKEAVLRTSDLGRTMEHFLSTGNIRTKSGLDLSQMSGFTVVADKLNQARFSSHFVAVHRGQYFTEMKTTTVRKLLPETWGFLCPVHTPDGSPCGLLNHLAHSARAVVKPVHAVAHANVLNALLSLGAEIDAPDGSETKLRTHGAGINRAWIMLDGVPVGHIDFDLMTKAAEELRALKWRKLDQGGVTKDMEIVCVTQDWKHLFTGLFLFLGPCRMVRPVRCLRTGREDWVGPLEQLFMGIAASPTERKWAHQALEDIEAGSTEIPEQLPMRYTHEELQPTEIFSVLASLTPFSNHNQSPRNMYQCQMLKQTMGTPCHNHQFRTDNKMYRIMFPQKPIVRTQLHNDAELDRYPQGTNAVIAVITYTGYDMEDAMIINKASYNRGFAHGCIYKTKIAEAADKNANRAEAAMAIFSNLKIVNGEFMGRHADHRDKNGEFILGDDGLPRVGVCLQAGDPLYCSVSFAGVPHVDMYKDDEPAFVENVTIIAAGYGGPSATRSTARKALIKLRIVRNPVVGDKFSSRHGQKGVMSILWPQEDMPFTESGVIPDILFNPHGFPSRMTIGMLIESIAAKTAAQAGTPTVDATTFREYRGHFTKGDNEGDPFLKQDREDAEATPTLASEYFGQTLASHGFQRLGTERMYSGIHGTEMETEIFVGVVYYQRLRHMVAEKAQVRSRGPVDRVTKQPLKGRKRKGGIRFGEMERDSLLAHGTAFLLHDRLMRSSDFDIGYLCPLCGSVLTPQANARHKSEFASANTQAGAAWECPPCSTKHKRPVKCVPLPVPWVFRYLAAEMAAMNIRISIRLSDRAREASLSTAKEAMASRRAALQDEEEDDTMKW